MMLKRVLAICLIALLLLPPAALAAGEAQQFRLNVIDPLYVDETGKELNLSGLTGTLSLNYLAGESDRQADMTLTIDAGGERALLLNGYLDEGYAIFSINGGKGYGAPFGDMAVEVKDLLYWFESFLSAANAVQKGEKQVNLVETMSGGAFPWREGKVETLGTTELRFFGEQRQALIKTVTFTPEEYEMACEQQILAMGFDSFLARQVYLTMDQPEGDIVFTVYDIGEREALLENNQVTSYAGVSQKNHSRQFMRQIGDELYEMKTTWEKSPVDSPEDKTTGEETYFVRRLADADDAGMITMTSVERDKDGKITFEASGYVIPVMSAEGWLYDISLSVAMDGALSFTDDTFYSDFEDIINPGNTNDPLFGDEKPVAYKNELSLYGSIAGFEGVSAFNGFLMERSKYDESETVFSSAIAIELSPYLENPIATAEVAELIDINNITDEQAGAFAYELIDAVSRAYVTVQEMPAVKEYMGKNRRISDLAK